MTVLVLFFFFNDTATTEIYTLSLHDALPIYQRQAVEAAFLNGVTVITGGPGTGKTTIVRCISYICDELDVKSEYC